MNKKTMTGIGIIISLAIVLILVLIFSGLIFKSSSIFTKNINSCESKGGKCVSSCDGTVLNFECESKGLKCCIEPDNLG